jgi:hypothetical protein
MGASGVVWFSFEYKKYHNGKIKIYAVRFGSVDF